MLTTRAEIRAFFGPKNKSNAIRMVLPMRGLNSTTQLASVCDRFQYGGRDLKFIKNIRKSKNSMLKEKFKVLQPLLASIMLDKFPAKYYVLEENERFDDIVESQAEKGKAEERIEDIVKIVCQNCDHDACKYPRVCALVDISLIASCVQSNISVTWICRHRRPVAWSGW